MHVNEPAVDVSASTYLRWCAAGSSSAETLRQREKVLRLFHRGAGVSASHAGRDDVDRWWLSLRVSQSTRKTYLSQLRVYYGWAQRRGLTADPTVHLDMPRRPRGTPRPVTVAELEDSLGLLTGDERVWVALAAFCGLRCAEIASLSPVDVHPDVSALRVHGKGGHIRWVHVSPQVDDLLARYTWPALTAKQVSERGRRRLHSVGVPVSMHRFRHFFGTHMYRTTTDVVLVQKLMGHLSIVTTTGYIDADLGKARDAVNRLSTLLT